MGWMNDVFGGSYSNPADASQPYLDKIPDYVTQYMQPYINIGQTAGNIAQDQYAKLASDPYAVYNEAYTNYNSSPWYNYQSDQMQKAAQNSAAAGGYAGTEADYTKQMAVQNALLDEDFSKYLNYIMQLQNTGLAGEQQMYNTGYGASSQSLNDMINYATASANNQFQGVNAQNQMAGGLLGGITSAAGLGYGLSSLGGMGSISGLGATGAGATGAGYGGATYASLPALMAL